MYTKFVVCFPNSTAAAQMQRTAARDGLPGRLGTAPRSMQVSCALAWIARVEHEALILAVLARDGIPFDRAERAPFRSAV